MHCYNCQTQIEFDGRPGRGETCPKCSSYLHCCLNCSFHDADAHNQCREPQAEWVKNKEMANFCGYFEAGTQAKSGGSSRKDEALKKLEELFKKKP